MFYKHLFLVDVLSSGSKGKLLSNNYIKMPERKQENTCQHGNFTIYTESEMYSSFSAI